jgi:hypothetical protein
MLQEIEGEVTPVVTRLPEFEVGSTGKLLLSFHLIRQE